MISFGQWCVEHPRIMTAWRVFWIVPLVVLLLLVMLVAWIGWGPGRAQSIAEGAIQQPTDPRVPT